MGLYDEGRLHVFLLVTEDSKGATMNQPYSESSVGFFNIEKEGSHDLD